MTLTVFYRCSQINRNAAVNLLGWDEQLFALVIVVNVEVIQTRTLLGARPVNRDEGSVSFRKVMRVQRADGDAAATQPSPHRAEGVYLQSPLLYGLVCLFICWNLQVGGDGQEAWSVQRTHVGCWGLGDCGWPAAEEPDTSPPTCLGPNHACGSSTRPHRTLLLELQLNNKSNYWTKGASILCTATM